MNEAARQQVHSRGNHERPCAGASAYFVPCDVFCATLRGAGDDVSPRARPRRAPREGGREGPSQAGAEGAAADLAALELARLSQAVFEVSKTEIELL